MRFTIHAELSDDNKWTADVDVPDGTTVFRKEVAHVLALALVYYTGAPDMRLNTRAEKMAIEAARALPTGWQPTLDATNVEMNATTGGRTFSRTYRYGPEDNGGPVVTAPCAEDGSPIPATREALLAVEHGRAPDAVAVSSGAGAGAGA